MGLSGHPDIGSRGVMVDEERLKKNLEFFTEKDPIGRIIYKRLEKV